MTFWVNEMLVEEAGVLDNEKKGKGKEFYNNIFNSVFSEDIKPLNSPETIKEWEPELNKFG